MFCRKCGSPKEKGERCKICLKNYQKRYRENNKDILDSRSLKWYQDNSDKVNKSYREDEVKKSKKRTYNNEYEKTRKQKDPIFKLRKNCSRLINHALNGSKNGDSIIKYLPYSIDELKKHLENQFDNNMSWENYGIYWHIDHIYPQSLLPYTSMKDDNFKKCWSLDNLRPLEAIENLKKSNKIVSL